MRTRARLLALAGSTAATVALCGLAPSQPAIAAANAWSAVNVA